MSLTNYQKEYVMRPAAAAFVASGGAEAVRCLRVGCDMFHFPNVRLTNPPDSSSSVVMPLLTIALSQPLCPLLFDAVCRFWNDFEIEGHRRYAKWDRR